MPIVRVMVLAEGGQLREGGEELLGAPGLTWVDVEAQDAPTLERLAQRYSLHRLAIEDCLHLDQRPKLEDYAGHQFLVAQGFCADPNDAAKLELVELHSFLCKEWLITVHQSDHPGLDAVRARVQREPVDTLGRGPDFLAYLLIDALVDTNFPLLDRVADELEDLEDAIFEKPERQLLRRAFELKRGLSLMRRVLSPQRDLVSLLSRSGGRFVGERTTLYFRDVHDHLLRLYEQIEALRDMISNELEAWLSVTANKANEITRQLTIFASIFMPLSFVVGFFGQNFEVLSQRGFFWLMMAIVVTLPPAMIGWFAYRRWL